MTKITSKNRKNTYTDEKTGKFKEGNPGKPLGAKKEKSFIEFYDAICEDIAKQNNMTVEAVKEVIYKVGYAKAKEGNYAFYKDILDRIHGQAKNNMDITSGGLPIPIIPLNNVQPNDSNKQNPADEEKDTDSTGGNISEQDDKHPALPDSNGTIGQDTNPNQHRI